MMDYQLKSAVIALALVLSAVVGTAAVVGSAAGQTSTDTPDAPLNQTVSVDGDTTRALYVSAANATGTLDVTVYAVENGSETQATTATLDATANTSDSFEWSLPSDPAGEYRVLVDGADVEIVDLAKIEEVQAGGGLIPSGSLSGISLGMIPGGQATVFGGAILLVLLGTAYVQLRN